ncbi:uncharacterized protein [Clytia hemisphaerica]|uniref:SCP domain-containing protein n=1 Tax=Clytia hemisphaerica TaxID=252671 RepID=A0A7M5UN47_9CNID|eukprot:TCONS_00004364-protein
MKLSTKMMLKSLTILLLYLVVISEAADPKCCIDLHGGCSEIASWMCDHQGIKPICPATCKLCHVSAPPYQNNRITTSKRKVDTVKRLCASEQNKYAGVNLEFHYRMSYYAQLYAEYMVKNGLTSKHDCMKRFNFPGLTTMVGNLNAFQEDQDLGKALKLSIKAWYNSGSNMKNAMTDSQYVGCGAASNGKITRVVSWYGNAQK